MAKSKRQKWHSGWFTVNRDPEVLFEIAYEIFGGRSYCDGVGLPEREPDAVSTEPEPTPSPPPPKPAAKPVAKKRAPAKKAAPRPIKVQKTSGPYL